jgi:hypothetical protein
LSTPESFEIQPGTVIFMDEGLGTRDVPRVDAIDALSDGFDTGFGRDDYDRGWRVQLATTLQYAPGAFYRVLYRPVTGETLAEIRALLTHWESLDIARYSINDGPAEDLSSFASRWLLSYVMVWLHGASYPTREALARIADAIERSTREEQEEMIVKHLPEARASLRRRAVTVAEPPEWVDLYVTEEAVRKYLRSLDDKAWKRMTAATSSNAAEACRNVLGQAKPRRPSTG